MKPAPRWPLHPAPSEGEALSSWLNRVALCYHMEVSELLEHDLGHGQVDDLDTAPPLALLAMLSQRSGIELDRLRGMSFAGWVPWLLDSLDDQIPDALETYAFQLSVLLPKLRRKTRSITSWRAWLPSQSIYRACPLCLNDPGNQAILLAWKLPLMLSCPLHGCWLESYWGVPGRFIGWQNADADPRTASDAIVAMDRRTWQALTTGYVELPRRRVHAGLWFRLLRTLLDELNTPLSTCGTYAGYLRHVWEDCGHPMRAGQSLWRPYETLDPAVRLQMLEAAATAINLTESRGISPPGEHAKLFWSEPHTGFTNGLPAKERKPEPVNHWQEALKAINEAIADARHNPETARSLFALASYGQSDRESLEQLRATFAKEQIPLEFLSQNIPEWPFACLRLNDGLSDKF
ncbi:TniQ family protein [Rhodoferax sp. U2-2l]|uniref:TniQ family protein n=1 Tax=Rhodoferax sp. U2-2l TaxID=2884000 RepID=UPI001D0B754C|nr:TniQ family protein [Rhodoferax sp. U2-2l]